MLSLSERSDDIMRYFSRVMVGKAERTMGADEGNPALDAFCCAFYALKEEQPSRPGFGDAWGVAYGPVVGVLDCSVVFDAAEGSIVAVLDRAVALYVS